MFETYSILSRPYYCSTNQCYLNILIIDRPPLPKSPLYKILRNVNFNKLSPFQEASPCEPIDTCGLAFINPHPPFQLATNNNMTAIFSWLSRNNYKIDTSLTQLVHQGTIKMNYPILAFISK